MTTTNHAALSRIAVMIIAGTVSVATADSTFALTSQNNNTPKILPAQHNTIHPIIRNQSKITTPAPMSSLPVSNGQSLSSSNANRANPLTTGASAQSSSINTAAPHSTTNASNNRRGYYDNPCHEGPLRSVSCPPPTHSQFPQAYIWDGAKFVGSKLGSGAKSVGNGVESAAKSVGNFIGSLF